MAKSKISREDIWDAADAVASSLEECLAALKAKDKKSPEAMMGEQTLNVYREMRANCN